MTHLAAPIWQERRKAHERRVAPWITPRLERRARGEQHPVDDFLFEYYPFSPNRLKAWHPGFGVTLQGTEGQVQDFLRHPDYHRTPDGVTANPERLIRHRRRITLVRDLLLGISGRPMHTSCFGMHEWAMVYGANPEEVRHQSVALRLSPDHIRQTVDDVGLRCTHIDAYRFFTAEATPRNAYRPTRAHQVELDQSGCLHANMDLYKYAMWLSPFVGSVRVADAFALAREARELDMRAAPYDLTAFGYLPIPLETAAGRQEYVAEQRRIAERAAPVRRALLDEVAALANALTSEAVPFPDSKCQPDPTPV